MTTTTKLIVGALLVAGGVIVYRRAKASSASSSSTTPLSTLRNVIDSGRTAIATATTAPPGELRDAGGAPYGTVSTTDLRKPSATTLVAVDSRSRTVAQNALLGFYPMNNLHVA